MNCASATSSMQATQACNTTGECEKSCTGRLSIEGQLTAGRGQGECAKDTGVNWSATGKCRVTGGKVSQYKGCIFGMPICSRASCCGDIAMYVNAAAAHTVNSKRPKMCNVHVGHQQAVTQSSVLTSVLRPCCSNAHESSSAPT